MFNDDQEAVRGRDTIFHSWRYTYASELVVLGASDIDLRYCMRHTDVNVSKEIYAQARFEDRTLYAPYKGKIKTIYDYNRAICNFDTDRRDGVGAFSPPAKTGGANNAESTTLNNHHPLASAPPSRSTIGGSVNADGSVTIK
ncbi:MAG: hypothetical protein ACKO5K_12030 [Armatimonadota bacterium]